MLETIIIAVIVLLLFTLYAGDFRRALCRRHYDKPTFLNINLEPVDDENVKNKIPMFAMCPHCGDLSDLGY